MYCIGVSAPHKEWKHYVKIQKRGRNRWVAKAAKKGLKRN